MLNVYYREIDTINRFKMSTQIWHWTNQLLIMSEMMSRVHLANMINGYNPEINIIYHCNRFYIGPLNHCFLSEIMTRVYIDVTETHLQLTNVSVLRRSTAVIKGQNKGIQGTSYLFTNVNSNWHELISNQ
jgi:Ni,Fe-hydrogenase I cytochrome b subunit